MVSGNFTPPSAAKLRSGQMLAPAIVERRKLRREIVLTN
jgi:hypothetical protein